MVDGKKQSKTTKTKSKNIGKSNETSPEEQAILEAKAKWVKQIEREDYNEVPENSGKQLRPMLALDYRKVPHRVNWENACSQPKLDGLRLTAGTRWIARGSRHRDRTSSLQHSRRCPMLLAPTCWLTGKTRAGLSRAARCQEIQ